MIEINCAALLLDIEGTVSPVPFVHDVMFPYARQHVDRFLTANWDEAEVDEAIERMAADAGFAGAAAWFANQSADDAMAKRELVVRQVHQWIDRDAKLTGLKSLQGMVWRDGFESGQLVAGLFPDVLKKLNEWQRLGLPLYIYSSGSVAAQKLFFGHTHDGDLLALFSGFFDTTAGGKLDSASYRKIADQIGFEPGSICFISDVVGELDAARDAGLQTLLRDDSRGEANGHPVIRGFEQVICR